jgi:hypothetical protein
MLAVPGHEEVAPVIRGQREVQGISKRISWHDVVLDGGLNDFEDCHVHSHYGERRHKVDATRSGGKVTALEFVDHGNARDQSTSAVA